MAVRLRPSPRGQPTWRPTHPAPRDYSLPSFPPTTDSVCLPTAQPPSPSPPQGLPESAPPLPEGLTHGSLGEGVELRPAGTLLSVLEGMVVMQGLANSPPLADG